MLKFIATINYILLLLKCCRSKVYTVGDEEGWNSDSNNYDSWSTKYNFSVDDILVFKYVKEQHNVYEVMESTYRSCDASNNNEVIAKYESGNDAIKLTQVKKYWFVCNVAGHCLGGMRFSIDVQQLSNNSTSNADQIPQLQPKSSTSTHHHVFHFLLIFAISLNFFTS